MTDKKKVFIPIAAVLAAALISVLVILLIPKEYTIKGTYRFYEVGESFGAWPPDGDSPEEHFEAMDIELDIYSKTNIVSTYIEGNMNYLDVDFNLIDNVEGNENKDRIILNPIANDPLAPRLFYLSSDYKGAYFFDMASEKQYVAVFEDEQPTVGEIVNMYERCSHS